METKPKIPSDRLLRLIMVLACSVALTLSGLSTYFILKSRSNYLSGFRLKSKTQAQLLGENTASLIYAVDASLLSARAVARSGGKDTPFSLETIVRSIQREVRLMPQVKNLVLIDADGTVIFSSDGQTDVIPDSFSEHRDAWLDFSISTRHSTDHASILLSRRLEDRGGGFLGVLAAEIDAEFFFDRYNDYLNITADAVMLFDSDGHVLASWANAPFFAGAKPGDSVYDFFTIPRDTQNRIDAAGITALEDDRFITAVYQTRGFPFRVAVGHEKTTLLQKWYDDTRRVIAIILLTYLTAVVTLVLGLSQRKKRRRAEAQLLDYQLGLEETVRKRTHELNQTNGDLREKNQELEKAITEIQMLKGIIPICCHCKNVRDDKGYWQQVELYIKSRSDAEFSHGICPDCAKKHYPGMAIYDEDGSSE